MSIEDEIERAVDSRVGRQAGDDLDAQERARINNWIAKSQIGGGVSLDHLSSKIKVSATPEEVRVWSREAGIDISVDHQGEILRPWRNLEETTEGIPMTSPSHPEGEMLTRNPTANLGDEAVKRQFVNQWEAINDIGDGAGGAFRQSALYLLELELRDRGIDPEAVLQNSRVDYSVSPVRDNRDDALDDVDGVSDLHSEAQEFVGHIDVDHLRDRLEGQGGGLRTSKPQAQGDTGLEQYVWRMARFHSGADSSMPVMAAFDLQDYLDNNGIDASVSGITDEPGKQITRLLDVVSQTIVADLGHDPNAGAERWEDLL